MNKDFAMHNLLYLGDEDLFDRKESFSI